MALVNLQNPHPSLGDSISVIERSQQFSGAMVNRSGLSTQSIPWNNRTQIEFNTEVYDVGGWFTNGTADERKRLRVPDGISMIRFFLTTDFSASIPFPDWPSDAEIIVTPTLNGVELEGYGRLSVKPLDSSPSLWTLTTPPIQCEPGDDFGVVYEPLTAFLPLPGTVAGSTANAFGIEGVIGG